MHACGNAHTDARTARMWEEVKCDWSVWFVSRQSPHAAASSLHVCDARTGETACCCLALQSHYLSPSSPVIYSPHLLLLPLYTPTLPLWVCIVFLVTSHSLKQICQPVSIACLWLSPAAVCSQTLHPLFDCQPLFISFSSSRKICLKRRAKSGWRGRRVKGSLFHQERMVFVLQKYLFHNNWTWQCRNKPAEWDVSLYLRILSLLLPVSSTFLSINFSKDIVIK